MKAIPAGIKQAFPKDEQYPSALAMMRTFSNVDHIIASLEQGEINVVRGMPVMRDWEGELIAVLPAMLGWCSTFDRIARRLGVSLDLGHLVRVANRLDKGMLLEVSDVEKARAIVERCKQIYMACPQWMRSSAVLDEQISIAMDEIGIRRAA